MPERVSMMSELNTVAEVISPEVLKRNMRKIQVKGGRLFKLFNLFVSH